MAALERWSALLTSPRADQALEAIRAIAGDLERFPASGFPESTNKSRQAQAKASLAQGAAGWALLFDQWAQVEGGRRAEALAWQFLDQAIDAVAAIPMDPALYTGFPGIAWAASRVTGRLGADAADRCGEVDDALCTALKEQAWEVEYDLVSGLTGLGVYFLERLPRPLAKQGLALVVAKLQDSAVTTPEGTSWLTPPRHADRLSHPGTYPQGFFNLGVAHGVPGVIGLLALVLAAGEGTPRVAALLASTVSWLLAQAHPAHPRTRFGCWTTPAQGSEGATVGWCYGDPGVASILVLASRCAQVPAWEQYARRLAIRTASEFQTLETSAGPGFCHGAAGLAHVFHRLHHATGEPEFAKAALHWTELVLNAREDAGGIGGFRSPGRDTAGRIILRADPSLLTGACGIALALLAMATDVAPDWDRVFLLS